jgi:hypothetical protein
MRRKQISDYTDAAFIRNDKRLPIYAVVVTRQLLLLITDVYVVKWIQCDGFYSQGGPTNFRHDCYWLFPQTRGERGEKSTLLP